MQMHKEMEFSAGGSGNPSNPERDYNHVESGGERPPEFRVLSYNKESTKTDPVNPEILDMETVIWKGTNLAEGQKVCIAEMNKAESEMTGSGRLSKRIITLEQFNPETKKYEEYKGAPFYM